MVMCIIKQRVLLLALGAILSLKETVSKRGCDRILAAFHATQPICTTALDFQASEMIFDRCILLRNDSVIARNIESFVHQRPSIFKKRYRNEKYFRKAVYNERISKWLQAAEIPLECCPCEENGCGAVVVGSILDSCSVKRSHMGISFMSEDGGAVLGFIEAKSRKISFPEIQRTSAYSISALAYSRWGRWQNNEPLVSLIISPHHFLRLIFTKSTTRKFWIEMKVEITADRDQMEYELFKYVKKYIEDFRKTASEVFIDRDAVNPFNWMPMNLRADDFPAYPTSTGHWRTPLMSQYGVLFRTSSDAVKALEKKYGSSAMFSNLPSGKVVFVKYLSALFDHEYDASVESIGILSRYRPGVMEAKMSKDSNEQDQANSPESALRPDSDPTADDDIVHPYINILNLELSHPLVVMHDVGDTLCDLVYCPGSTFRSEWQRSRHLRAAFLSQVGRSALNLVSKLGRCHNDIRPTNIAVRDGRFCLIDFDLSRTSIVRQHRSAFSPHLQHLATDWHDHAEKMMCYTVAQIVVNVFILSSPTLFSLSEVTEAVSIWAERRDKGSKVDRQFQEWVDARGEPLVGFVAAVRGACNFRSNMVVRFPLDFKAHFVSVLRRILVD